MVKYFRQALAGGAIGSGTTYAVSLADVTDISNPPTGFDYNILLGPSASTGGKLMVLNRNFTEHDTMLEALRVMGYRVDGIGGIFDGTSSIAIPRSVQYAGDAIGHGAPRN